MPVPRREKSLTIIAGDSWRHGVVYPDGRDLSAKTFTAVLRPVKIGADPLADPAIDVTEASVGRLFLSYLPTETAQLGSQTNVATLVLYNDTDQRTVFMSEVRFEPDPSDTPQTDPVTSLIVVDVGLDTARIQWTNPTSPDFAGVHVYKNGLLEAVLLPPLRAYTFTGLEPGTDYVFSVAAFDTENLEAAHVPIDVRTDSESNPVVQTGPVTGAAVTAETETSITVDWTNPADPGFAGTRVYQGGVVIATVTAPTSMYTATGLNDGTSYTFTLVAYDTTGLEAAGVSVTGDTDPSAPTLQTGPVTNVALIMKTRTEMAAGWTNPTSPGFRGVNVYRDGILAGTVYQDADDPELPTVPTELTYEEHLNVRGTVAADGNLHGVGYWYWPTEVLTQGVDEYRLTVKPGPSVTQPWYWASQFGWSTPPNPPGGAIFDGGYFGMQTEQAAIAGGKGLIFSIWNVAAEYGTAVGAGRVDPFDNEGEGVRTLHPWTWAWDLEYEYVIRRLSSTATRHTWTAHIVIKSSQLGFEIGRISTPVEWGKIVPSVTFLERYGTVMPCGSIGPTAGNFSGFEAKIGPMTYYPTRVSAANQTWTDCDNLQSVSSIPFGYRNEFGPGEDL